MSRSGSGEADWALETKGEGSCSRCKEEGKGQLARRLEVGEGVGCLEERQEGAAALAARAGEGVEGKGGTRGLPCTWHPREMPPSGSGMRPRAGGGCSRALEGRGVHWGGEGAAPLRGSEPRLAGLGLLSSQSGTGGGGARRGCGGMARGPRPAVGGLPIPGGSKWPSRGPLWKGGREPPRGCEGGKLEPLVGRGTWAGGVRAARRGGRVSSREPRAGGPCVWSRSPWGAARLGTCGDSAGGGRSCRKPRGGGAVSAGETGWSEVPRAAWAGSAEGSAGSPGAAAGRREGAGFPRGPGSSSGS